jgi:tetratricopeptide (TPR) repeat protein
MPKSERPPVNDLSGMVHGSVVQAGSVGHVIINEPAASRTVPFQLPPQPPAFTSRDDELSRLRQWQDGDRARPLLVVISGASGVGKTTLALRWLHEARDQFPGGQLYVDLAAFGPTGPLEPEQVLDWFLLALGVPPANVPAGLAQRTALYRSVTADRAIAVLLDNAFSAAQVRPLLPASGGSTVVVTSRWRLPGLSLDGARFIEVDPLSVGDSVRLLDTIVGSDRFGGERDQAEELARLCGGMPIALSVVGARLSAYPHRSISRELRNLRGDDRLSTLAIDESSVAAIFDVSYSDLPIPQQRTYRMCALHPGSVFGVDVAAAAVGDPPDDIEESLDDLVDRNLIKEIADRRFRYHDLLLVHARQQVRNDERGPAVRRMIEWYLDHVVAADLVLRPTRRRFGPRFRDRPDIGFASHAEALAWLSGERGNLHLAVFAADEHGWDELTWQFCEAMWGFYLYARNYDEWLRMHAVGIPAAQRCGDLSAEASLRAQLASALTNLHRFDDAVRESSQARELAERAGDEATQAVALGELARALQGKGELRAALAYVEQVKRIRDRIGTERAAALAQRWIGEIMADLGRCPEAVATLRAAVDVFATLDQAQYARALTILASVHVRCGHEDEAAPLLTEALAIARELGSSHYEAEALFVLGDLAWQQQDFRTARESWSEAMKFYVRSGDRKVSELKERLARSDS